MTSKNSEIYEHLKNNLYQDDAIIGEAAGLGMGLVMMGMCGAAIFVFYVSEMSNIFNVYILINL